VGRLSRSRLNGRGTTGATGSGRERHGIVRRGAEDTDGPAVHGHAVAADVTTHDRGQMGALLRDGQMHAAVEFGFDLPQLRLQALAHRLSQDGEAAPPRLSAAVREPEEVERRRLGPTLTREAAEGNQSRLVRMQLQTELREPLAQLGPEPFGLMSMLEAHDEAIGETDHDDVAAGLPFPPSLDPEVEDVMEIEVGQQRADRLPLRRPCLAHGSLPVLQHAGSQPSLDEAHDAPVRDAMLDKADQPHLGERVEEAGDVGVEHPVHLSRRDPDAECVERMVRASSRPEPVREPKIVLFVDRAQDLDDGALDELVFQRGNAERPQPPVRLRDERSTNLHRRTLAFTAPRR
jgi:hypothetical protein